MIAVFLTWSHSLVISRQSHAAINFLKIFHAGYFYSNLSVITFSEIQSGHFKMLSINWEQIAGKYRYCEFNFKCLAFLNSWKVHQQRTPGTVRVVKDADVGGQTNNHCITISMQKSSSIHQFILEMQHKYFTHFWLCPPKTIRSNF